jgi:DNA invertase Pin-like site-specific DNA recombinase
VEEGIKISRSLIRQAENLEVPYGALLAIMEVRHELDRLELAAIEQARAKGTTWESIARALGITRQALHQRVQKSRARAI